MEHYTALIHGYQVTTASGAVDSGAVPDAARWWRGVTMSQAGHIFIETHSRQEARG